MAMVEPPNGFHVELAALLRTAPISRRRVRAGEALFYAGDSADWSQLVLAGLVGLEVAARQREPVIARLYKPGDMAAVGRMLYPGSVHEGTGRALVDTEVQLVRWSDLPNQQMVDKLRYVLVAAMASESRWFLERMVEATHLPAVGRVALALCRLADSDDVVRANQEAVAAVAGVVRVTANAELRRLAARNLVHLDRRRITLLDRPALERLGR